MKRGAKPKPQMLKELHNTTRKDRDRVEPEAPPGPMTMPEQLGRMKYGQWYWEHTISTAPLGMLKPADIPQLESLCTALSLRKEAMDHVITSGMMVLFGQEKDPTNGAIIKPGVMMQNPFMAVVNKQAEIARKISAELGLVVTGRARLDFGDGPIPTAPAQGKTSGQQADRPQSFRAFVASNPQYRPN